MKKELDQLKKEFLTLVERVSDRDSLETLHNEFLGRKGKLKGAMQEMAKLADGERKAIGKIANEVKEAIEIAYGGHQAQFNKQEREHAMGSEWVDVTQPGLGENSKGSIHPVTQVQQDLEDLFTSMGFMVLDGPELESDYYNFTALNIPPAHPARDMQDTFYVEGHEKKEGDKWVMRTQTSSVQVRALREYGVPIRAIIPGRCFRNEATDARHEHTFHQLEGLVVGKGITFADMKGVFQAVADYLYGKGTKIRLMPKFYPFVEPGVRGELECFLCKGKGCRVCKQSGWLEVMPGGMVHPNVLREGGIDPEVYSGFAFGFGLTRLVMLKYGIDDIRHLESGDLRFLKQF
ncbi:MAG: phenylalanine--tRNA ligase subunit alpha [Parcubacteria group bacterium]|nr:phenylalanine--tRNA ligase subunit alpha [Parcubacteria group bacterium]